MKLSKNVAQSNGRVRQFIAAIIVNLVCLSYGICVGWSSPMIPQLRSNQPPIGDTPMSEDQIPWLNSLLPIGGFLTIPFCGILSERIGHKNFAHLIGLPHIVSWLLVIFAQNYIYLFVARLFIGIAGAMTFFIVPIYVSEIASEEIRGALGSLLLFSLNIGVLLAYVAGALVSYRMFACLSLIIPIVFLVTFALIPETPVDLVRRNFQVQAHKSLMFFRDNNEALVEQELTKLRSQTMKTSDASSKNMNFSNFFKDRAARNGLIISFGLLASQQLSGIFAMMSYAETIFKRAGSSLSADTASMIIAVIQIIGSYMSTMLIERAGRRLLTLISCFGMTVSHAIVGLFFYLQLNNHDVSSISWLPLVALSSYIITFCLGAGPVPFVVISEVFRLDFSSIASTVCYVFYFAIAFTAIRSFDLAMQFLEADGCFFMLAIICAISFFFCYRLLPETKGRKREDIIDELASIHKTCREKVCVADQIAESKLLNNSELHPMIV